MSYSVAWFPVAENRLIEIWLAARDRISVRTAADRIEERLGRDPHQFGESRTLHVRIAHEVPLGVYFYIDELSKQVLVFDIFRI